MLKSILYPWNPFMVILFTLSIAMSSCKKNSTELPVSSPSSISVDEAKSWLGKGPSGIQAISNIRGYTGAPNWENASIFNFPDKTSILKVPLIDYELPIGYRDLLFRKTQMVLFLVLFRRLDRKLPIY